MRWCALVPLKSPAARKSRLAGSLDATERGRLVAMMLARCERALRSEPGVEPILLAGAPEPGWNGEWVDDEGLDLNAALDAARRRCGAENVMVVLPDLPLVDGEDIAALLRCAERTGVAIAPDRHLRGTNAVAVQAGRKFRFAFGPASFALHRAQLCAESVVVRPRLQFDCDTESDLRLLRAARVTQ